MTGSEEPQPSYKVGTSHHHPWVRCTIYIHIHGGRLSIGIGIGIPVALFLLCWLAGLSPLLLGPRARWRIIYANFYFARFSASLYLISPG